MMYQYELTYLKKYSIICCCRSENIEIKKRINNYIFFNKEYYKDFNIFKYEDVSEFFFNEAYKKNLDNFIQWSRDRNKNILLRNLFIKYERNLNYIKINNIDIHKEKGTQEKWDARKLKRVIKSENIKKERVRL